MSKINNNSNVQCSLALILYDFCLPYSHIVGCLSTLLPYPIANKTYWKPFNCKIFWCSRLNYRIDRSVQVQELQISGDSTNWCIVDKCVLCARRHGADKSEGEWNTRTRHCVLVGCRIALLLDTARNEHKYILPMKAVIYTFTRAWERERKL